MEQVIKKRLQQVMDASVAKGETPGCLLMVIKDGEEQAVSYTHLTLPTTERV